MFRFYSIWRPPWIPWCRWVQKQLKKKNTPAVMAYIGEQWFQGLSYLISLFLNYLPPNQTSAWRLILETQLMTQLLRYVIYIWNITWRHNYGRIVWVVFFQQPSWWTVSMFIWHCDSHRTSQSSMTEIYRDDVII